jgi:hypothetical protein
MFQRAWRSAGLDSSAPDRIYGGERGRLAEGSDILCSALIQSPKTALLMGSAGVSPAAVGVSPKAQTSRAAP